MDPIDVPVVTPSEAASLFLVIQLATYLGEQGVISSEDFVDFLQSRAGDVPNQVRPIISNVIEALKPTSAATRPS